MSQVVARGDAVYIADYQQAIVYKLENGTTTLAAGVLNQTGHAPDGAVAAQSPLDTGPSSIDVGPDGTVYIAEAYSHYIRAVLPDGTLKTIAGNGTSVDASQLTDASNATQTAFDNPAYVKVGPDGDVYTYDTGIIRRILPDGSTDHVVGAYGAYPNTNPYVDGGIATEHAFGWSQSPFDANYFWKSLCVFDFDANGNLYATVGSDIYFINMSSGVINTYHTNPSTQSDSLEDTPLVDEYFGTIYGLDVDSSGNIWIDGGSAIQYISPADQIVHTAAGGGSTSVAPAERNHLNLSGRLVSIYPDSNGLIYYINGPVGVLSTTNGDTTPPVITPQPSAWPNQAGWANVSPITLSWNISDPQSDITSTSGCDPVTRLPEYIHMHGYKLGRNKHTVDHTECRHNCTKYHLHQYTCGK